ncbi:MAG TPA: hypothetical protein VGY56_20910 [Verrucomicrobiae bacterium]|nr:hypothetical protein [Verrucomicrobiae bacterium]
MAETTQKNFRMSPETIRILQNVARALGVTETEVIQTCVAKYALEIGQDVEGAKELLLRQICELAAKSPGMPPRTRESIAAGEEVRRAQAEAARPSLPQSTAKLHDTVTDLEKAIHVAEGLVEKARKRSGPKRK